MKRLAFVVAAALLFLSLVPLPPARAERDGWLKVRSRNFLLVGNAGEREIRLVAAKLEQFREVFKRLFVAGQDRFDSFVPTTVIVFRDDLTYEPFAPLYQGRPNDVAGYFQSSPHINYITLSADARHVRSTSALAFHEYVHLLVKNSFARAPLWFNEGLAEFYSTFEIENGNRRVKLGQPLKSRVHTLRQRELLPLSTLFGVDYASPYYNEAGQREIFYAESWALIHYLLNGGNLQRRAQFLSFLNLLAAGHAHDEAFRQAFQTDTATLENELRLYVQLGHYAQQSIAFDRPLSFDTEMTSSCASEAEAQFYLGDLLLHTNRVEAAEPYLVAALKLDENFAPALISLGLLRLRQNRFAEAIKALARAVTLNPQSYLAHYYYADALSREGMGSETTIEGYYQPEALSIMRAELKRAIELAPQFVESYRLLALINLVMNEQLEEAGALLRQALELAPQRRELTLLLAQVHLRQVDFQAARTLLSALLQNADSQHLRAQAQALLEKVAAREELAQRLKLAAAQEALAEQPVGVVQPCDAPQPGVQKKPLRFNGEQICGNLVSVACDEGNVVLSIEANGRTLRLRSNALNRIRFVTYTNDVRGQMTCGPRQPATPVLVTYRATTDKRVTADGEVFAVEFIPKEWYSHAPAAAP